jgi:hypothetical protein
LNEVSIPETENTAAECPDPNIMIAIFGKGKHTGVRKAVFLGICLEALSVQP